MEVRVSSLTAIRTLPAQDFNVLLAQVSRSASQYMQKLTLSCNVEILTLFIRVILQLVRASTASNSCLIQLAVELSS